MSFYASRSGKVIDGSAENTFAGIMSLIPDGTTAPAFIKKFEKKTIEGVSPFYEVTWKIADGDFKNREVRQKIKVFDMDNEKADRALNMLVRLFKLCEFKPTHSGEPNDLDLLPLQGKMCGIKIQVWSMKKSDGNQSEGNWVSEVHPLDDSFVTETGYVSKQTTIESALTRNPRVSTESAFTDDDIPF